MDFQIQGFNSLSVKAFQKLKQEERLGINRKDKYHTRTETSEQDFNETP